MLFDWPLDASSWKTMGCLVLGTIFYLVKWLDSSTKYKSIPTVGGPSAPLLSYWGALKYFRHASEIIQEGYNKYRGGVFRVADHNNWNVIVTGRKLIEELKRAPDNVLSFHDASNDAFQLEHTIGPSVAHNNYHFSVIRTSLTRNIGTLLPDIRDELQAACEAEFPVKGDEWTEIHAVPAIMQIISRISSRVFVGLPLCRNRDYNDLSVQFSIDIIMGAITINLFPKFLRPIAAKLCTIRVSRTVERARVHLEPIILERYRCMEQYGDDWVDKPNDFLQWLMEEAVGEEKEPRLLILRILVVNFAAIHTSSMSFTHALYRLAAFPEHIAPLREEVEEIIEQEGWSKTGLQKMRKVDSYLKECQRVYGLGSLTMVRKAMQDFTFSDGTFIPKGSFVQAASAGTHTDAEFYEDPFEFNPWRFSNMREEGEGEETKHQMVNAKTEYIAFGLGKHACPGRFFAAKELKALLAHVVLTYDVKMEKPGEIPAPIWYTNTMSPNRDARVLFRRRQTASP